MKPKKTPGSAHPALKRWARRVALRATWRSLPPPRAKALRQTVTALRGASATSGRVLLAGADATAKTHAAQVLARELGAPLYRVNLATLVSRYIGETEKNLAQLLAAAAASEVVLLIDEADALFGKRGEVRDAHDRYANIELAAVRSQVARHPGLLLLAAPGKGNLDEAFIRRFRFVVELPAAGGSAARER